MTSKELAFKITTIQEHRNKTKELNEELLTYCKDTSNPFQARWTVWYDYVDKEDHPWIFHFKTEDVDDIFVDCDYSRYQRVELSSILDILEENKKKVNINEAKEELIQANLGSFKVDW